MCLLLLADIFLLQFIPLVYQLLFWRVYSNEDGTCHRNMWNIGSVTTMPIVSTTTLIVGINNRWDMYTSLTCRKTDLSFASFEVHHSLHNVAKFWCSKLMMQQQMQFYSIFSNETCIYKSTFLEIYIL